MLNPAQQRIVSTLGVFLVGQVPTQLLNALTGLLLVRWLPKNEYAWFTLGNTLVAACNVLLEPASGVGLQSYGGPMAHDRPALSRLIASALHGRWGWLSLCSLGLVPWTFYLLFTNGASLGQSSALCLVTLLSVPAITGTNIYGTVHKLQSRLHILQWGDVLGASYRLICSVIFILGGRLAIMASAATAVAQWGQFILMRSYTKPLLEAQALPSPELESGLARQMNGLLFHGLFQCFQAQIGIWLMGVFGSVESLADLGALMRLGVILGSAGALFQQILIPALSRCESTEKLRGMLVQTLLGSVSVGALLVMLSQFFPQPFLWILGGQYQNLHAELVMAMIFFSLSTLATVIWWFNTSRGWTRLSFWVPFSTVGAFILAALFLKPSNTYAALVFQVAGQIPSLIIGLTQTFMGLQTPLPFPADGTGTR